MEIEQIKKILERYNEGTCTADESRVIEQWFDSINRHHTTHINEADLRLQLEAVKQGIHEQIQVPRRRHLRPWYYSAAAAVVLLAAGAWYFQFRQPGNGAVPSRQTAHALPGKSNHVIENGHMIITTAKGATERVMLEDGSTVIINASSRLRYPVHFSAGRRDIYLEEGEAFFKVAGNPRSTFTVHAAGISTTALGTSFNVRAYTHEKRVTVALLSGKVQVDEAGEAGAGKKKPLILLPSEKASYDLQSLQLVKTTFARKEEVTGWQQGYLVFKDATYNEVITEIENRYGVTIINESDKKEWKYTGGFREESLQDVVETICLAESLAYTINNDTIVLRSLVGN